MLRARLCLWMLGRHNRTLLDQMCEVVCGTRKNYEMDQEAKDAPLISLLVRRWLDTPARN